jgi:hypothetical protein
MSDTFRRLPQSKLRHLIDGDPAMLDVYVKEKPANMTKLVVEMFPGIFVGITLPTRYLIWTDDKPRSPEISRTLWRKFLNDELTLDTEMVN